MSIPNHYKQATARNHTATGRPNHRCAKTPSIGRHPVPRPDNHPRRSFRRTAIHPLRGFTLIELMIVVAIVAILAAVSLPAYNRYRVLSAENACLAEMKSYTGFSIATLHSDGVPDPAPRAACASADNAPDGLDGISPAAELAAAPNPPGVRHTRCSMETGACSLALADP